MKLRQLATIPLVLMVGGLSRAECGATSARAVLHYPDGLRLSGSQTVAIEDAVCHIGSDVELTGAARLVVRNSKLLFEASRPSVFGTEASVTARDEAIIDIGDSELIPAAPDARLTMLLQGHSESRLENVTLARSGIYIRDQATLYATSLAVSWGITVSESGSVYVKEGTIESMCLEFEAGDTVTLSDLRRDRYDSWQTPGTPLGSIPRPQVRLDDCSIGGWAVHANDTRLVIRDSELFRLGLYWSDVDGSIEGLAPGYFAEWHSHNAIGASAALLVDLYNTTVTSDISVGVLGRDGHAVFTRCAASFQISDFIGRLDVIQSNLKTITIKDSDFALDLSGSVLVEGIDMLRSHVSVAGELMEQQGCFVGWLDAVCEREFTIAALDDTGSPITDAEIHISDDSGREVTYVCDNRGEATFRVRFDDRTWRDSVRVRVTAGDHDAEAVYLEVLSASRTEVVF
jgi:hypothetical protein